MATINPDLIRMAKEGGVLNGQLPTDAELAILKPQIILAKRIQYYLSQGFAPAQISETLGLHRNTVYIYRDILRGTRTG